MGVDMLFQDCFFLGSRVCVIVSLPGFPGVVVLLVTCKSPLDVFVHRLNTDLVSALKFLVEFKLPNEKARRVLWERCVPAKCPVGEGGLDWRKLADASQARAMRHAPSRESSF